MHVNSQTDNGLDPITVTKNKIGAQYGASVVMLTPELHKLVGLFINIIQPVASLEERENKGKNKK